MQYLKLLTFGGGTNSTALLIELVKRNIKIDFIIFSDTGAETPQTYEHINYMQKWLKVRKYPEITIVKYKTKEGIVQTLEDDCHKYKRLPSLAYGFKGCSIKYKRQPQDKFLNNNAKCKKLWKEGGKILKIIGFDADEPHRAERFTEDKKYKAWYPLIEWDYGREECIKIIKNANIPTPGKSSCFFCPAMKVKEIKKLATCNRSLFDRAVAIEDGAILTTIKGLGRNWSWKRLMKQEESQTKMFNVDIACDCYDG